MHILDIRPASATRPTDRVVRSTSRFNAGEDHPLPVRKADENFIDIDATATTPGEKKKNCVRKCRGTACQLLGKIWKAPVDFGARPSVTFDA
ncbi:hypothetical protein LUI62_07705 [Bradyrhizobium diazoefficiens]|uniref:Uncharacterized protein n=1 Tax=Bradyrhizobium diazoefficiens SEMIA 5080 TaxID=754504 RepID=A0A837CFU0_9BRAD|nr:MULTISPECIES: hypothetical protein [Bradyrhizobium]KGJ67848.1 hypothetical protein BJA5080_01253 [Bradyrhizobium diazoefficiens SEMIA 5080]MCD9827501.1 hypothetical protein [Bradyrhizobium diazoefficiens]MDK4225284.1 hypothetical protein [Bradyrhizobium diazoefficiens]UFW60168.1 hypothetical protein BdzoCB1809_11440 [Bradyrhizobium diazoefficiens]WRJ00566.1 hypothetical protein RZR06_10480 [Bradyrhizobium diazoefficiens]